MYSKTKAWIVFVFRSVLLVCCCIGVHKAVLPLDGGWMSSEKLLYFTYQSNLLVLLITAVYLGLAARRLVSGTATPPRWLQIVRYVGTVTITITFLVFWGVLAPAFEPKYLFTLNNQLLHTAVPILYTADFLLFDRGKPMSKAGALWAISMPLYYLIFSLSYAAANPGFAFRTGGRYPYFFLDLDTYGWFGSRAGMGVLWWSLILLCLTLAIGYFYRFLQLKANRQKQGETPAEGGKTA